MIRLQVTALVLAVSCLAFGAYASAVEADVRLKWFGTSSQIPRHDVLRPLGDSPLIDQSVNARLMFQGGGRGFEWVAHHSSTLLSGDSEGLRRLSAGSGGQPTLDQTPVDDRRRLMDLTWPVGDGKRHRSFHRLDRLAFKYRGANWAVMAGREAVSWGSGRVFQPMDLFNPFAPTVVDRDFKAGDDLVHAQFLTPNGSDLELLAVGRRNEAGDVTGTAASVAAKWHGFAGAGEYEVVYAKHYRDRVIGATVRVPIGGALLRTDIVATREQAGGWRYSGVVNIDYSLDVSGKSVYLFAEYYRNGFGVSRLRAPLQLPRALMERIGRGEVFALMKNYLAAGGNVQWHALVTQNLTLLTNLHDSSSLVQTSLVYDPGDSQRLEFGLTIPTGRPGDEYGGLPVARDFDGRLLTSGGGTRVFARWVYYF